MVTILAARGITTQDSLRDRYQPKHAWQESSDTLPLCYPNSVHMTYWKNTSSLGWFTVNLRISGLSSADILLTDYLIVKVSLTQAGSNSGPFSPATFPPVASNLPRWTVAGVT